MINDTENMDEACDDQQDPTKCNPPKDSAGKKRRAFVKKKPRPPVIKVVPEKMADNVRTLGSDYSTGDPNKYAQAGNMPKANTKRLWKRP